MVIATTLSFWGTSVSGSILFTIVCALLAASKGRSALTWGVMGFFFQCFGLLFVVLAGDVADPREQEELSRSHRRRINERLKRESNKIDQLKSEMRGRLDAHDLASGIDTRRIRKPLNRSHGASYIGSSPSWYYDDHGATAGPIAERALRSLMDSGLIHSRTLIWREGMTDWRPWEDIPELG